MSFGYRENGMKKMRRRKDEKRLQLPAKHSLKLKTPRKITKATTEKCLVNIRTVAPPPSFETYIQLSTYGSVIVSVCD